MKPPLQPKRILMVQSHSAGIGDLLRGSAAWRVLKNAYPAAELHLLILTRHPGYVSEGLMREHHLLKSCTVIDKRTKTWRERRRFWSEINQLAETLRPDLFVDFEPSGLRTSTIALWLAWRWRTRTVGITTLPGRNLFYSRSAPPPVKYASLRGFTLPLEYTHRDFVVLAGLGLERNGTAIEMRETAAGRKFRETFRQSYGLEKSAPLLGINIGCGTVGAEERRPNLKLLSELAGALQRDRGMRLVLTGAPFERAINEEFIALHRQKWPGEIIDLAGKTSLSELTGALAEFAFFISGDSGPYHMAVGMRVPTLAIFNWNQCAAFHSHPWVRCCVASNEDSLPMLLQATNELLAAERVHIPV